MKRNLAKLVLVLVNMKFAINRNRRLNIRSFVRINKTPNSILTSINALICLANFRILLNINFKRNYVTLHRRITSNIVNHSTGKRCVD